MITVTPWIIDGITTMCLILLIKSFAWFPEVAQAMQTDFVYSVALLILLLPPVAASIWIKKRGGSFAQVLTTSLAHVVFLGFWVNAFKQEVFWSYRFSIAILAAFVLIVVSVLWFVLNKIRN